MAIARKQNWPTLLHRFLLANQATQFRYGVADCCLFAADAINAITGTDLAAEFRGYTTQQGALKSIVSVTGGSNVADALAYVATKFALAERKGPLFAQRGDLVLCTYTDQDGETEFAGVVDLTGKAVAIPGALGLMTLPLSSVTKAWAI